ncbi:hypothetical protein [Thiohalophilus thiocyanatoxydans]|uniref:Uncharacterized protein n=1 Tax=Thiohalophilus thiocyanatoxydans TaxID=381308 RepID=A0A4R8ITD0_9GAMM|nr:hypothetical protein [Thiohalophilus thiocyanatoxydans]TDY00927.1 hypothetical protein EDC23_1672 [Thiohalophilus thiocyanatoxydans]
MNPNQPDSRIDEYFVIRIERQISAEQSRLAKRDIFLGADNQLVPIKAALRFEDADLAARHIEQLDEQGPYQYIIQFCSEKDRNASPDELETLINEIMEIPYPYRRTAYNWLRGRDVQALLRRESEEVCERHRRVLLEHDIDITRKSDIILMKPKRGKFNINTGQSDNAPRQYFAYPGQKPLPVPSDEEDK